MIICILIYKQSSLKVKKSIVQSKHDFLKNFNHYINNIWPIQTCHIHNFFLVFYFNFDRTIDVVFKTILASTTIATYEFI